MNSKLTTENLKKLMNITSEPYKEHRFSDGSKEKFTDSEAQGICNSIRKLAEIVLKEEKIQSNKLLEKK